MDNSVRRKNINQKKGYSDTRISKELALSIIDKMPSSSNNKNKARMAIINSCQTSFTIGDLRNILKSIKILCDALLAILNLLK